MLLRLIYSMKCASSAIALGFTRWLMSSSLRPVPIAATGASFSVAGFGALGLVDGDASVESVGAAVVSSALFSAETSCFSLMVSW